MNAKYQERVEFFENTVACKPMGRALAAPYFTYLPMTLYGETTIKETIADWGNAAPSYIRYHEEFQPDLGYGPTSIFPGKPMAAMDCQFVRWPGRDFDDDNIGFQIVDKEYMAQEEYLEYAEDPTGFMMRKVLPRHYGALKGLGMIDFSTAVWQGGLYATLPFNQPEVRTAIDALFNCGKAMAEQTAVSGKIMQELADRGFPAGHNYVTSAPFDIFNDTLRGFLNVSMDMYECPDELLTAVNTATKVQVRQLENMIKSRPIRAISFMLHNGFDSFMSREHFQTFYWPGLKACIDVCIKHNVVPWIYVEDSYMSKLDIIERDVPEHKVVMSFLGGNDMKKVKERFGSKYCLRGGLQASVLEYGSKDDVIKMVKNAIDIYAPGGGYILDVDVSLDKAKPENLHALFDTARNYIK